MPEELRYRDVTQYNGASYDLVFTNTSEYCARKPEQNGCAGSGGPIAQINMDTGCDTGVPAGSKGLCPR